MVSGRRIELRFETVFEKKQGLFFVFVKKDSCESHGLFRVEAEQDRFDSHRSPPLLDQTLLSSEIREIR